MPLYYWVMLVVSVVGYCFISARWLYLIRKRKHYQMRRRIRQYT